jgi:site-specific recombinase XerC
VRVSEACGLLWRNVRPREESGQITVFGKGGRTQVHRIARAAVIGIDCPSFILTIPGGTCPE